MDNNIWKKTKRGIRYREHPTRKHSVPRRPDRYYVIRFAVGGVISFAFKIMRSRIFPPGLFMASIIWAAAAFAAHYVLQWDEKVFEMKVLS